MTKFFKWIFAGVGIVVVLFVIAALVLPMVVDPNNYKEKIRTAVYEETGRELTIGGEIQWTVFPSIGLGLSDLELGNRSGFGDQPMLKIGTAGVSVKLVPLFSRKIEVGKVSLNDLSVNLRRKANGQNNWEDLSGPRSDTGSTASSGNNDFDSFVISGVEISNANVTWDDAGQIIELKGFGLKASNIKLGRPFDLKGGFSISLAQSQLSGEVKFGGLVQSAANGTHYGIEGFYFSFAGTKGAAGETRSLDMAVNANADLDLTDDLARLSDFVFRFNGLSVYGELEVAALSIEPELAFDFQIDSLNLDDYIPESEVEADEPDLTVDVFRGFKGSGEVRIGELIFAGLTATDVSLKINGNGRGVRLFPISARFYGGQHQGDIEIDASGNHPILITSQQVTGVQAEAFLQDLTGSARLQGVGDFSLKVRTDLTNSGTIRQALSGDIGMHFLDGAIVGINVAETIRSAQAALGQKADSATEAERDPKTDFSELSMTGVIRQGILTSDDFLMLAPLLRVTGKGTINLVKETIDYLVKPTLVGSLQGQGGQGLDELNGVPVPVKLTGNLYEPDISVDIVAAIVGSQQANIAEKRDELTDKVMGQFFGEKDDSDTGSKEADAGGKDAPAKSLLNGIFGGKKDKDRNKDGDGNGAVH